MKLLIMGGSQFVSRAIAKALLSKGHHVTVLTRGQQPLDYTPSRHIIGDRINPETLKQIPDDLEGVIDVSGYTPEAVELLLSYVKDVKRYVFISTGAVYQQTEEQLTEMHTVGKNPVWGAYGMNKLMAEQIIKKSGLDYVIFRPSYIYGPGNNLYRQTYFIDAISTGQTIFVPEGDHKIQLVHIEDVCGAVQLGIDKECLPQGIYNLSYPEDMTFSQLIETSAQLLEKKAHTYTVTRQVKEQLGILYDRQYFPYRNVTFTMDTTALSEYYKMTYNLKKGLKTVIDWYSQESLYDPSMNAIILLDQWLKKQS